MSKSLEYRMGRKREAEIAAIRELRERATVSIKVGGAAFGVGRDRAYAAAAAGQIPTIRLGPELRVISAKALQLLGLAPSADTAPPSEGEP